MKGKLLFIFSIFLTSMSWANDGNSLATTKLEPIKTLSQSIDISQIFSGSPIIYTVLMLMSVSSVAIWLYSLFSFRSKQVFSYSFIHQVKAFLENKSYDEATEFCEKHKHLLSNIVLAGITARKHGAQVVIDTMKSEGKRSSASYWQKLSLLNDIVIIAPMLGLLGTVIGMFYAFYDVNRSLESINALFDGLGIAVGTTVVGLIVAILAMMFYTSLKYRLVNVLSRIENEALSLSNLIEANKEEA
jgi:biopolymer transport protein ExbB